MSDHIPFEIQVEIIKRLPIKSLIQFRSVSNTWKSLIDSSEFIADYKIHHYQSQRLLLSYIDREDSEVKCVLIDDDDDDNFPQRKCSLNIPKVITSIDDPRILGSSHGLLCLYGYYEREDSSDLGFLIVVLWNPSIRKSVAIKVPNLKSPYHSVFGFGVCPHTNEPKIVKINQCMAIWNGISSIPLQVEVFTLSSKAWRLPFRNLPRKSIGFNFSHIALDGFIYWLAFDRGNVAYDWGNVDDSKFYNLIISFELTSEEFGEIYLPEHLAQQSRETLSVSKLRDSLLVLHRSENGENLVYGVWVMEHGVPYSFTKVFTFDIPNASLHTILEFRKNGEPMFEMDGVVEDDYTELGVYEPSSKRIKGLGVYGEMGTFFVSSYMETLILLDHRGGYFYFNM